MEKTCATCRYKSKSFIDEPCNSCTFNGGIGDKWEPLHACYSCKHCNKKITEEPCLNCDIRMRNDKWEVKDE